MQNLMVVFHIFCFGPEVPSLGKFGLKIQNCLFKVKFNNYNHSQNIWDKLVFMWNSILQKKLIICFPEIFTGTGKMFTSGGGLSTRQ